MKQPSNRMTLLVTTALLGVAPASAQDLAGASDAGNEIVVTANKREERLQDVPLSVSVISGDQIVKQNINDVTDLTRSAPALNSAGPFGSLNIRGIGSTSFARSAEGSVGLVIDGVALANANPPQLFDIARVEVLEGPQGTLFGRNSSAGVVNITTNAPDPSRWEVIAHADVATRDNYIARAVLNIPIASNAALRVSGSLNRSPRTEYNRFDDSWNRVIGKSVRGRFLWEPTDELTFNLIGDYSRYRRGDGAQWTVYHSTPGSLLTQRLEACGVTIGEENQQGCIDSGNRTTAKSYGFSGQVDARIGDLTLTSISAYRAYKSDNPGSDADSVPVDRLNVNSSPRDIRNFSQEVRLASPTGGMIDYLLGFYYFDSELSSTNSQYGPVRADMGLPFILGQIQETQASTTSVAGFANITAHLSPAFRLLAGARIGKESISARTIGRLAPGSVAPIIGIAPIYGQVSDSYFSYKVGAQYDLTPDVMAYATYTRGYKGPSVNDQTGSGRVPLTVAPEVPHASEIGLKADLFDRRLTASIAGFHNRVSNFQAQFFDPDIGGFVFGNAPKLTSKGVSVNFLGRPARGLTLNLGLLYNDARYGDGYLVACAQAQTAAQGCETVGGSQVDDAGGNRLVGAPKWKATGFAEYTTSIGGSAEAFGQIDVVYTSRINFDAAYSPLATSDPAAIFGGRIGVRFGDGRYGASIFARNIFDVYRPVFRFGTPTAEQQLDPLSFSQVSGPESRRVIGLSVDARF
jgi:iron complex outermembrane receptor protein